MKQIASFVNDLTNSQSNFFMIKEFNKLTDRSPVCFYNNISHHIIPANFAVMNSSYIQHFSGDLICAELNCAEIALRAQTSYRPILYLWDVFFIRGNSDYEYCSNIIGDDRLQVICRSQSHATVLKNYCGKEPIGIVEDWDVKQLGEILWT
jgi:hypothetical protein